METITWRHQCLVCERPIQGGNPWVVFSTDRAGLVGVCHTKCSYGLHRRGYGRFRMHPPDYLSTEQVSFLMHFFPKVYSLPGAMEANNQLRSCLARLLWEYPDSMNNPMTSLRLCMDEDGRFPREEPYEGDLEADFLRALGEIQRSVKATPLSVEVDFGNQADARAAT